MYPTAWGAPPEGAPHAVGYIQARARDPAQPKPEMFVSWSVYPKGQEYDVEFFTSEDHAVDVAYSWSAEEHGKTMIVQRNGMNWMEVTA